MALALELVKTGFSPQQARGIGGQVQPTVSGAGTTLATGTALTAGMNIVTTCADGAGVVLPDCQIGDEIEILNLVSGNACRVYPPTTSDQVNQLSAGSAFLLGPNTAVKVKRFSTTRFMAWLSA